MGDPTSFKIQEITGNNPLSLELFGRAMPYRGPKFTGEMRAEFTRYPGNPVATVQVLGANEGSTTFQGMWKDRFIRQLTDPDAAGNVKFVQNTGIALFCDQDVRDVMNLVKMADRIRRRGQLLRVTWDELVYHGILRKFSHAWDRREDVNWEMEFEWVSQGEPQQAVAFNAPTDPSQANEEINNWFLKALATASSWLAAVNVVKGVADEVVRYTAAISNLVGESMDVVSRNYLAVVDTGSTVKRLGGIYLRLGQQSGEAIASLRQQPAQTLVTQGTNQPVVGLGRLTDSAHRSRSLQRQFRELRAAAIRRSQEMSAQQPGQTVLAIIVSKDGQNLRDISTQFYGTPSEWQRLAQFNGLHQSRLTAGTTVIVPKFGAAGV